MLSPYAEISYKREYRMTTKGHRSVLWLPSSGGPGRPGPSFIMRNGDPEFAFTWIYDPAQFPSSEGDVAEMEVAGQAYSATTDDEALELAIRLNANQPFEAVVTLSEGKVPLAARIAESLGLRSNSVDVALRLTDKAAQRAALSAGGVPVPRNREVSSRSELVEAAQAVKFPAILKPVRGASGKLIFIVDDFGALDQAWQEAEAAFERRRKLGDTLLPPGGQLRMVLEELLVPGGRWHENPRLGDYVSVDTGIFDGEFHHVITMDKLPLADGYRENGHIAPSVLPADRIAEVHAMTGQALRALGVTQGMCHTELKLTAQGPRVIEVNGRPGGCTAGMMLGLNGYQLVRELVWQALGRGSLPAPDMSSAVGMLIPRLDAELSGRKVEVKWAEDFTRAPGFREFYDLGVTSFDVVAGNGAGVAARAYVEAADPAGILMLADQLRAAMTVTVREENE